MTDQTEPVTDLLGSLDPDVEGLEDGDGTLDQGAIGRSYADAPEIDGNVYVDSQQPLKPGDKVWVRVTDADEYDLWAEAI